DQKLVEDLIGLALETYSGRSPVVLKYKAARATLFSGTAALHLAREALKARKGVPSVLTEWYIGTTTRLGLAAIALAIAEYLRQFDFADPKIREDRAVEEVEFFTTNLLATDLLTSQFLYRGLAAIVLSSWTEKSEAFRRSVLQFVLGDARLGNPR